MNPEDVSEALYECERAIQDYTDRVTSHLRDSGTRDRTLAATLVLSTPSFFVGHSWNLPQEKRLKGLANSVKDAHTSVSPSRGERFIVAFRYQF
jgi:hypothetical protein